jgi:hypothetical protein
MSAFPGRPIKLTMLRACLYSHLRTDGERAYGALEQERLGMVYRRRIGQLASGRTAELFGFITTLSEPQHPSARAVVQPHASPAEGVIWSVSVRMCRLLLEGKWSENLRATGLEIRRWGNPSVGSNPTLSASNPTCLSRSVARHRRRVDRRRRRGEYARADIPGAARGPDRAQKVGEGRNESLPQMVGGPRC